MSEDMRQFSLELDYGSVVDWIKTFEVKEDIISYDNQLNIVDLYSGCGGMTLGALAAARINDAKLNIDLAIDFDRDSIEVYSANFKNYSNRILNHDIRNLFDQRRKQFIPDFNFCKTDVLFAGPPCQGHSDLNNSTRRHDERNALYYYCRKAIDKFDPELIVLENVTTVVHSKEKVVQRLIKYLDSKKYFSKEMVVKFQNLGIPQKRERHILIASKSESFISAIQSISGQQEAVPLFDFISDYENSERMDNLMLKPTKLSFQNKRRIEYLFDQGLYDLPDELRPSCHRDKVHSYNSCYGRLNYNDSSQTITSGFGSMGQGRYVHPTQKRTILAVEAARIQGFPKSFDFSKASTLTSLRRMIANAVPPQLTFSLIDYYLKSLNGQYRFKPQDLLLETF